MPTLLLLRLEKIVKPSSLIKSSNYWFVIAILIFILIIFLVGFIIDSKGFLINFLSGLCVLEISIIVALLIVDKYIKY